MDDEGGSGARLRRSAPFALAALSGVAALVYELVWVRWFAELFGSTAYAASAVFAAYFGGLAIGSRWFAARAPQLSRPLIAYALLEAAALLGALLVPGWLELWHPLHSELYAAIPSRSLLTAAKLGLAFVTLAPPCIALGGTLPVLIRAVEPGLDAAAASRRANLLYGVNTFGGAIGIGIGVLWLPQHVGVRGTYAAAVILQSLVIAAAIAFGRRVRVPTYRGGNADDRSQGLAVGANRPECWAAAAAGFGALSVQILLLRALDQVVVSTFYNTGATLCATLAAIGFAALLASRRNLVENVSLATLAIAVGLALIAFPSLFVSDLRGLAEFRGADYHWQGVATAARVAAWLGLPILTGASMLLPWIIGQTDRAHSEPRVAFRIGRLLAWNIAGGVVGSVAAGFLLLPLLGLWGSVSLLAAGYLCCGIAGLLVRNRLRAAGAALTAVLWAVWLEPWHQPHIWLLPDEHLVDLRNGPYATVAVVDDADGRAMRINNHYTLAGTGLRLDEERRGHLPLLMHPTPNRVAVLGSSTGLTASAALIHPEVRELDLIEIVPEVAAAASEHFADWNRGVYSADMTTVFEEDARNHMRVTRRTYDVVIGELFVPWNPGASGLFSREHFVAVRGRLASGGIFCHWLPLHQLGARSLETIVATYRDVFPAGVMWRGGFHPDVPLVALCSEPPRTSREALARRLEALGRAGSFDRWLRSPEAMAALELGAIAPLRLPDRLNTTDRPWVEISSFRDSSDPMVARRWHDWSRGLGGSEAGFVLFEYQLARLEGREGEVQRLAERARSLLPADVFSPFAPSGAAGNVRHESRRVPPADPTRPKFPDKEVR